MAIISKVYVTKYALTKGILVFKNADERNGMIAVKGDKYNLSFCVTYIHKGDWFTNPKEAINKAESMRIKKIESLKRQIKKLENNMKFEIKED